MDGIGSVAISLVLAGGGFSLPRVFGFHKRFQAVQACLPEDSVLFDPRVDGAQRFGIEVVNTVAPFTVLAHKVRAAQQAQVLGNGGAGDGKGAGNLPGGLAAAAEQVEDGAARGIGQCVKGSFLIPERRICNRTVTHNA